MYALVDETGKIIQISGSPASGIARWKIDERMIWTEFKIPSFLIGKEIKYDPIAGGLVEDTEKRDAKIASETKREDALTSIRLFDKSTAELSDVKDALQSLIDLVPNL